MLGQFSIHKCYLGGPRPEVSDVDLEDESKYGVDVMFAYLSMYAPVSV